MRASAQFVGCGSGMTVFMPNSPCLTPSPAGTGFSESPYWIKKASLSIASPKRSRLWRRYVPSAGTLDLMLRSAQERDCGLQLQAVRAAGGYAPAPRARFPMAFSVCDACPLRWLKFRPPRMTCRCESFWPGITRRPARVVVVIIGVCTDCALRGRRRTP